MDNQQQFDATLALNATLKSYDQDLKQQTMSKE